MEKCHVTKIYLLNWLTVFLGYSSIVALLTFSLMVLLSPYRMEHISAFLDPWDSFEEVDCGNFVGISLATGSTNIYVNY
jgi:cell division protein FtsW (lipid II flippase)